MAIELVTGSAGTPHVSSADVGAFNAGFIGSGNYVLKSPYDGGSFNLEVGITEVKIHAGEAVINGRHVRIPFGSTESVPLQRLTGAATRVDTIAIKYVKDADSLESASIEIIKGTEGIGTYNSPAIPSGNILNGDSEVWFPLYNLIITGIDVSESRLFRELNTLSEIYDVIGDIGTRIANYIYPVGSIYISTDNKNPGIMYGGSWAKLENAFLLACSADIPLGTVGGNSTVKLSDANLPSHTHTLPVHSHAITIKSAGAHKHTIPRALTGASGTARNVISTSEDKTTSTSEAGAHTHVATCTDSAKASTNSAGAGSPFSIMPPYFAVNVWYRIE